MAVRVYATEEELVAYGAPSGVTLPIDAEADRQLQRASELIDQLLVSAVYDTDDETQLPTDEDVAAAMRDAVCAQVVSWATGATEEAGTLSRWQDVQIGSVRLGRGSGSGGGSAASPYAEQAVTHLRLAGLIPGHVIHGYGSWG